MRNLLYQTILSAVFYILHISIAYAQNNTFEVKSRIKNWNPTQKYVDALVYSNGDTTIIKELPIVNGQIEYKDTTSNILVYEIFMLSEDLLKWSADKTSFTPTSSSSVFFIAEPGAKILLEGEINNLPNTYPTGTKLNEDLKQIIQDFFPLVNDVIDHSIHNPYDSTTDVSTIEKIQNEAKQLTLIARERLSELLSDNLQSFASLYIADKFANRNYVDLAVAKKIIESSKKDSTNYFFYDKLNRLVNSMNYDVGSTIFDIEDYTPNGEIVSTKSLRGKYYLIDFWGYWCKPCMEGMPILKQLKEKYPTKLEIVGINVGDKIDRWKSSLLNNEKMNWLHFSNGKNNNDYAEKLNIKALPTKILVSPEGKILYREQGESKTFKETIERFLTNQ